MIHTLNVVVIAMLGRIEHHPGILPTLRIYLNHLRRGPTQLRREAGQAYFGAADRPKRGEKRQRLIFPVQGQSSVSLSHRDMLLAREHSSANNRLPRLPCVH